MVLHSISLRRWMDEFTQDIQSTTRQMRYEQSKIAACHRGSWDSKDTRFEMDPTIHLIQWRKACCPESMQGFGRSCRVGHGHEGKENDSHSDVVPFHPRDHAAQIYDN